MSRFKREDRWRIVGTTGGVDREKTSRPRQIFRKDHPQSPPRKVTLRPPEQTRQHRRTSDTEFETTVRGSHKLGVRCVCRTHPTSLVHGLCTQNRAIRTEAPTSRRRAKVSCQPPQTHKCCLPSLAFFFFSTTRGGASMAVSQERTHERI